MDDNSTVRGIMKRRVMSNLSKHANDLNAVLKFPKTRHLTYVPGQQIAEV